MAGSAGLEIALGFLVAMVIFTLWAWWMVHDERQVREVGLVATTHGDLRRLPVSEPTHHFIDVSAGSVCHVAGSIGFTPSGEALVCTPSVRRVQPRWRHFQIAA